MSATEVPKPKPEVESKPGTLVRQDAIVATSDADFDKQAKAAAKTDTSNGGALAFSELKGGSQEQDRHQQQNQDYQHDELPVGGRRRRQNSKKKSQHKKKHGGSKKHQNKSKKRQNKNKRQRGGK